MLFQFSYRASIDTALEELLNSITDHPKWIPPPSTNATLFYLWDFIKRSKYMLSEYPNIKAGRPVENPRQSTGEIGKGQIQATKTFSEVCVRTFMVEMMVNDTSGKAAMITGQSGAPLDFGKRVKDAVAALQGRVLRSMLWRG